MRGSCPVLGALEELPTIRRELEQTPRSQFLPEGSVEALAQNFLRHCDLDAIRATGRRAGRWPGPPRPFCACGLSDCCHCFRVAYAQDEAFGGYFPDTLEALEALGAELVEFSPLRDEALPEGVDLVMIGCGFPDQHADALAANLSMIAALRQHVCRGQRIYSEGGGTAYLGRSMILDGRRVPGAGILPFDAELLPNPGPPVPVTRTLHPRLLARPQGDGRPRLQDRAAGDSGRASSRSTARPASASLTADGDLYYHHHAVGSLIHLHLGALPEVVAAFAGPHRPSLKRPSIRGLADQG